MNGVQRLMWHLENLELLRRRQLADDKTTRGGRDRVAARIQECKEAIKKEHDAGTAVDSAV